MKNDLKDWQIAQKMFGKNTKKECDIVKQLRKHGEIYSLCEDWSIITDKRLPDDCGFLISNECLI